jgi:hypothetical protein
VSSLSGKCQPCNTDGEDKQASSWCKDCQEGLCEECFQLHKKFRTLRNHEVVPLHERAFPSSSTLSLEMCEDHEGRKIEMFCESHLAPCCVLCVTMEHGKCKSICSIEEATDKVIKPEMIKHLQNDVDRLEVILEKVIVEEKANICEIEDVADKLGEEISGAKAAIIETVEKLSEKHLEEVGKATKDAKAKLKKSINSFEQRQCYLRYWKEMLVKNLTIDGLSKTLVALSYTKMEQIFQNVKKMEMSQLNIRIRAKICDDVPKLMKLPFLAEIATNDHKSPLVLCETYLENAKIKKISEFNIDHTNFTGGVYLRSGELVLADDLNDRLIHCTTDGEILREASLQGSPWDACVNKENEILVTLPTEKKVLVLNIETFNTIKTVEVDGHCYGIAQSGNIIAVGCEKNLQVFNTDFKKCRTTSDLPDIFDVAVDIDENVVYSSDSKYEVRKQDREGNAVFTYSGEHLKRPYGLTVDRVGNIYVGDRGSNNVHILSQTGRKLKIVNDAQNLQYISSIKFQENHNTNKFLVTQTEGRVKIFDFMV